ncbi:hypothetical protein H6F79_20180 [Trichocoleus sp. FACHB-69]|nr:hypothetical protein [Trichocoleus sp. FACHB-69]MBD1934116.1 hypothetical protein [Trichocoleus sp. FACHB-69]
MTEPKPQTMVGWASFILGLPDTSFLMLNLTNFRHPTPAVIMFQVEDVF